MTQRSAFRYFKTSPEIIRMAVMMYIRFPLSLRNVGDLLHERGIDICHETVRFWWHRFGPMFAAEIRKRRVEGMRSSHWRWHLDEARHPLSEMASARTHCLDGHEVRAVDSGPGDHVGCARARCRVA